MNYALPICLVLSAASAALAPLARSVEERVALVPDEIVLGFDEPDILERWVTVNDNVMGGRSTGGFSIADGRLVFEGSTNTNGGGFSSIRTRTTSMPLAGTDGLLYRVRGDGRTYIAGLRNGIKFGSYDISYWAQFETTGDWQTVRIPYTAFTPTFFGEDITGRAPALEADSITGAEIYIYDKKDGPFRLEIEWIGVYSQPEQVAASTTVDTKPADNKPLETEPPETEKAGSDRANAEQTAPDPEPAAASAWAMQLLLKAIDRGVPQFNKGNQQACADIYEIAIASLVTSPTPLPGDAKALLQSGLRAASEAHSHTDRAWAYRYAMDAALAALSGTDTMEIMRRDRSARAD